MRNLVLLAVLMIAPLASADAGSDAGSGAAGAPAPAPAPAATGQTPREVCVAALNADPTFAADIVKTADKAAAERRLAADAVQHEEAARHIETNERHVIVAYAAMWLVAVAFVLFLGSRQLALRREIALLRRDLEAATKEQG